MSLPAEHSSLDLTLLVFSLGPLLKYHLLRESFPDHPTHKQFPHPTEHPFPDAALFSFIATPAAAAAAKSLQSCPTPCDPMDCSPPGFSVHGILQARTLEWVAISFSNAWKWKVKVKSLSCARLLANPWTAAYQAPPSMGFSGQQYWRGVPLPSPNID